MLLFILLVSVVWFVNCGNAQVSNLRPVNINNELAGPNVFTVFSPTPVCYNKSSVPLNFSLTAHEIGTIAYSLDNQNLQCIQTSYVASESDVEPFLINSETSQVTVMGTLVFDNLPNGDHTLRLYLGHQSFNQLDVEAFTEIKFSVKAPTVMLIQKQDCYTVGNIPLELIVSEPTGLIYSLDNQGNDTIFGNTTLTGLSSGYHNVTVYAFNGAGSWCASNTLNFEIIANPADSSSPDSSASISQQHTEFPFLMIFTAFAVLICCLFPLIRYLERANEQAENSK